jgi:hypothetical protein
MANKPIPWTAADRAAVILSFWGFTTDTIAAKTNLTKGQVAYRIRTLNLQHMRHDYRHGTSLQARALLAKPTIHGVGYRVSEAVTRYTTKTKQGVDLDKTANLRRIKRRAVA